MNPADYRVADRAFVERVHSYAESPGAFRHRWRFRFRWSPWLVPAVALLALAGFAWHFGDLHLALKGMLAVMALVAVLPLVRDFRRPQCRECQEEAEALRVRKLDGERQLIIACHRCRLMKVHPAAPWALPL